MKDDLESNVRFIELIRERPCLYDNNRIEYSNRGSQDAAWQEISKLVNGSVADCREKWKNIRGCYTRHLKNIKRSSESAGVPAKQPYYLAGLLHFLDPYVKSKPKYGLFSSLYDRDLDLDQETKYSISVTDEFEDNREFDTLQPAAKTNEVESSRFKVRKVSTSEVNTNSMQYFMECMNQDPDFAFLYSLLPDVKEMNGEQKRRFKVGVLNLAGDILQQNSSEGADASLHSRIQSS